MKLQTILGLFILVQASCSVLLAQPSNGLAAYYPFNGDALEATGTSSNGNVLGGATFAPGIESGSLLISSEGNRVEIPPNSAVALTTNDKTISVWFYADTPIATSGTSQIFKTSGSDYQLQLESGPGLPTLRFRVFNSNEIRSVSAQIALLQWHHALVQKTGDTVSLYLNGLKVGSTNVPAPVPTNKRVVVGAGGSPYTSGFSFHGKIDELRFYDRALTEDEIAALFRWSRPAVEVGRDPFRVCWQSRTGRTYQVQYRLGFETNSWVSLGSAVPGDGTSFCLTNEIMAAGRFYQLLITP